MRTDEVTPCGAVLFPYQWVSKGKIMMQDDYFRSGKIPETVFEQF
jgi:hypothetical protein